MIPWFFLDKISKKRESSDSSFLREFTVKNASRLIFTETRLFIATMMFGNHIRISPPFFVLTPKEDGGADMWNGTADEFTHLSKAYTRNGFLLDRGSFPWGDEDRVFFYLPDVCVRLLDFEERKDVVGLAAYCDASGATPFPRTFQR
jgi:hypothetical protein